MTLLLALEFAAALGCGLVAGVFFAFSTFVMNALARLPAQQGIAGMQSINIAAINPWFMTALFGTAAACVVLVVASLLAWREPGAACLLAGGTLYLVGAVLVTMLFNVPLNRALARVEESRADNAGRWAGYVARWTAWNHVRTATSLAATALITLALYLQARGPTGV
ncbi:MAG: DUF1772 domain-containing protein [Dongiaceae bacterium]